MNLYYDNYLEEEEALRALINLFGDHTPMSFYIIYPSWLFQWSCNIIRSVAGTVVEGKYGSQKGISEGTERPDFRLSIPLNYMSQMKVEQGPPPPETGRWIGKILFFLKRTKVDESYAEAAMREDEGLVFYEFSDLSRSIF